jgi:hypothetical protein
MKLLDSCNLTNPAPSVPQYTGDGQLKRPANYRTWVFVGANLGLGYNPSMEASTTRENDRHKATAVGNFHNIYITPAAYEQYVETGQFPDKTMLAMDVYRAGDKEPKNIVSQGHFEAEQSGFEVAVKNSQRPDGSKTVWAYYVFPSGSSSAPAQADSACYQCHLEHADDDNVWVQFYPILRDHKP